MHLSAASKKKNALLVQVLSETSIVLIVNFASDTPPNTDNNCIEFPIPFC